MSSPENILKALRELERKRKLTQYTNAHPEYAEIANECLIGCTEELGEILDNLEAEIALASFKETP